MSVARDVVVIGGGPNGLTAAGLLARGGRRVMVVERREMLGGLAASEEFHPGFRSAGVLSDTSGVRPWVVRALDLERHGLRLRALHPPVLALDGARALALHGEPGRAAAAIRAHSREDAEAFDRYRALLDRLRPVLAGFLDEPPVDPVRPEQAGAWELVRRALRIRRLGRDDMMELLRVPTLSVADWLDEWFETDLLKGALALPAVAGTFLGPRSPGSNANLLLRDAAAGPGVEGGGGSLVDALAASVRALGVEVLTAAPVRRIEVDASGVRGVTLHDGRWIEARTVAASCDPRRALLELLPAGSLPSATEHRIRTLRMRGTTARVLLALREPLRLVAADGPVEHACAVSGMDALERAHDAIKYRRHAETPVLDIHVPTVSRPELASGGGSVVSILVHFVSHDPVPPWTDGQRDDLGDRVVEILDGLVPGAAGAVVARVVHVPQDLEEIYGVTGGQIHHVEHELDQRLVRPVPECHDYRTPVRGLYLCGSGSHPGGGLTCGPGALAASAMLADVRG